MRFFYIVLSLCSLLIACKTDNSKDNQTSEADGKNEVKVPIGELAEKLYVNYTADPKTQAEKDENVLIEYAVEKGLDVSRTSSGMYYLIKKQGVGPNYIMGQPCLAHYSGYFLDGSVFDSSHRRGRPLNFFVGQMMNGWNEALQMINTGTVIQLLIPSKLAYGSEGFPGYVQPNTPLIFDVEMLPLEDSRQNIVN